jgi:hypothetical protein
VLSDFDLDAVENFGENWIVEVKNENADGVTSANDKTPCGSVWSVPQLGRGVHDSLSTRVTDFGGTRQCEGHQGL